MWYIHSDAFFYADDRPDTINDELYRPADSLFLDNAAGALSPFASTEEPGMPLRPKGWKDGRMEGWKRLRNEESASCSRRKEIYGES